MTDLHKAATMPCPFCGEPDPVEHAIEPHVHHFVDMPDHSGSHVIECGCGAGFIADTREAVLALWNRRPALREALAAPVVPPGYALVPVDALKWLHGEEGEFDCPPEGYFRGKPAPYWWRSVFRKMCAAAPQPKDKP